MRDEYVGSATFADVADLRRFCGPIDETIQQELNRGAYNLDSVLASQTRGEIHRIVNSSLPVVDSISAGLTIEIDKKLSNITYRMKKTELEVDNPAGIWACRCDDPAEIDCPIHSHPHGDAIFNALTEDIIRVHYDGIDTWWVATPSLFPLSRDPIYAYENLLADGIATADISSVLDIGCGTGFLGTSIAASNPNVEAVRFGDQLLMPIIISKLNQQRNNPDQSCYPALTDGFNVQIGWDNQPAKLADVCVCNPPYLPVADGEVKAKFPPGFVDSGLLEEVIRRGDAVADTVYLHISDLVWLEAAEAAAEYNAELNVVGEKRTVPFRLTTALDSPTYL